jgi:putative ABC transport system permease protein
MATTLAPPPVISHDSAAEWRAGWRVALRLARRDVRRHLGRSLLIVIMVAVPVLLLIGGNIIYSSADLSTTEQIPYGLGQTQAVATYSGGVKIPPMVSNWRGGGVGYMDVNKDDPATPIPGWGADSTSHVLALESLLGGTIIPMTESPGFAKIGRKQIDLTMRGVDAARFAARTEGITHLQSGRWPTSATEAVVSPAGIYRGLPSSGTVEVTGMDGKVTTYTIVGVGDGWILSYAARPADLVTLPDLRGEGGVGPNSTAYLIDRAAPVTWDEVRRWADYGLQVTSRQVVLNPPTREQLNLPPEAQIYEDQSALGQAVTSAIIAVGLLLETTLLVGPAFAVSAARQRRTLALAASNGATTPQLRRSVLAQALVLGALASVAGAIVGVLSAWVVIWWSRTYRPDTFFGPFDVPVVPVTIIVGCAIASAVIAALIPSRGLGRLDIVGVMRGQNVSPPALVRTPIAGIVLAALGAVAVFWAVAWRPSWEEPRLIDQLVPFVAMIGAVLLVIGALLLVPMVLVLAGRATRPAPVAIRMAMRDAARQRGRATSTVAAILGGTALLSTILVVAASDSAFRAKTYRPELPMGQAKLIPQTNMTGQIDPRWSQSVTEVVRSVDPALQVQLLTFVDVIPRSTGLEKPSEGAPSRMPFFVALRVGCTPLQALTLDNGMSSISPPDLSCNSLKGMGMSGDRGGILVADLASLVSSFGLDATAQATLRAGGIVVNGDKAPPVKWIEYPGGGWGSSTPWYSQVDIIDGKVTFARGNDGLGAERPRDPEDVTTSGVGGHPGASGEAQRRQRGDRRPVHGLRRWRDDRRGHDDRDRQEPGPDDDDRRGDHRGPARRAERRRGSGAVRGFAENSLGWFYVERGFQPYDKLLALIVLSFIGLIILVATLVSTALSTAETQSMMGTFAAVGATRMTRRNLAAAQAGSLGWWGRCSARWSASCRASPSPARRQAFAPNEAGYLAEGQTPATVDPTVVIPWLQLAVPILLVPALAALLAWLAIRKAPTVTRRLT